MKNILSHETPDATEAAEVLATRASLFIQEEDRVIDISVETAFLKIFASLIIDLMNRKTKKNIRSLAPDFEGILMNNPSLTEIAFTLSCQYHFVPPNLRDIGRPVKKYFETNSLNHWIGASPLPTVSAGLLDLLQVNFKEPLPAHQVREMIDLIFGIIPPANTVQLINNSLSVRRLDSLARLLAVDRDLSVCTSVSFFNGKVILASNNSIASGDKNGVPICQTLINRFIHIRSFIQSILRRFELHDLFDLYALEKNQYQSSYEALLREFVYLLKTNYGGTQFEDATLYQAVTKLIYSSMEKLPREFCLRPEDRACLLESLDIVALTVTPRSSVSFQIPPSTKSEVFLLLAKTNAGGSVEDWQSPIFEYLPLNELNKGHLSKFHAEQLNASYVLNLDEADLSEPHEIGVSKLCCPKCHEVLQGAGVFTYRGNHHSVKLNIVDVLASMPRKKMLKKQSSEELVSGMEASSSSVASVESSKGAYKEEDYDGVTSSENSFNLDEDEETNSFPISGRPYLGTELMKRKLSVVKFFDKPAASEEALASGLAPAASEGALASGLAPAASEKALASGLAPAASEEALASGLVPAASEEALASGLNALDEAYQSPKKRKATEAKSKSIVTMADQSPFFSPGLKHFLAVGQELIPTFQTSLSFENE